MHIVGGLMGLGQSTAQVQQMVIATANQYGVPPAIALGVAAHESGFNATAQNPNSSAAGVMQLLSVTQQTMGVTNPLDAQQNITAGVQLLAQYYATYGNWTTALYAYADGPGAVASPGYQPSAMAQQFASYVTGYTPASNLDLSDGNSILSSMGLSTPTDDDSSDSSSFAASLGLSDTELAVAGIAVAGLALLMLS